MSGVDCRLYQIIAGYILKNVANYSKNALISISRAFALLDYKNCGKISKIILKYCIFTFSLIFIIVNLKKI